MVGQGMGLPVRGDGGPPRGWVLPERNPRRAGAIEEFDLRNLGLDRVPPMGGIRPTALGRREDIEPEMCLIDGIDRNDDFGIALYRRNELVVGVDVRRSRKAS